MLHFTPITYAFQIETISHKLIPTRYELDTISISIEDDMFDQEISAFSELIQMFCSFIRCNLYTTVIHYLLKEEIEKEKRDEVLEIICKGIDEHDLRFNAECIIENYNGDIIYEDKWNFPILRDIPTWHKNILCPISRFICLVDDKVECLYPGIKEKIKNVTDNHIEPVENMSFDTLLDIWNNGKPCHK